MGKFPRHNQEEHPTAEPEKVPAAAKEPDKTAALEPTPAAEPEKVPAAESKKMMTVRTLRVRGPERGFRRGGQGFGKEEKKLGIGKVAPEIVKETVKELGIDKVTTKVMTELMQKHGLGKSTPEIMQKLGLDGMVDEAQALAILKEPQLVSMETSVVIELE